MHLRGKREALPHSAWHRVIRRTYATAVSYSCRKKHAPHLHWFSCVKQYCEVCMKLLGVAYNPPGSCAEVLIKCEILLEEMPTHLRLCSGANSSSQLSSQRRSFVAWAHFTAVMHAHEALQSSCIRLLTNTYMHNHTHTHSTHTPCTGRLS